MENVKSTGDPNAVKPGLLGLVDRWEAITPQDVALRELKTDPRLQPRDPGLIRHTVDRLGNQDSLTELVEVLATCLRKIPDYVVRPILVADTGEGLFVVDGHHRVKAFSRARRSTIPACVLKAPLRTAMAAARLANCRGSTVPLHRDEVKEAVWEVLSELLRYGTRGWEAASKSGYSYRVIEDMFGAQVGRDTIQRMVHAVPVARELGHSKNSWPRWRALCKERRDGVVELPEEGDAEAIERLAHMIAGVIKDYPNDRVIPAFQRAQEMRQEAVAALEARLGPWIEEELDPEHPEYVY